MTTAGCPKCGAESGDAWSQCDGACPIEGSPYYVAGATSPKITIEVNIEWPTGGETVEFEVNEGSTDDQINTDAQDVFFNHCNYGWNRKK